ncbi:MAG: glucosamine inositolphosphorylceramide transferase family protein [Chloroflexota bacterium]
MPHPKLRLGILLDSFDVPAWVYAVIQRIRKDGFGEIALVVLTDGMDEKSGRDWSTFVYSAFHRMDERLFGRSPNPFAVKDAADLLAGVPVIGLHSFAQDGRHYLSDADLASIKKYGLDILLRFGCENLQVEGVNASTYGTWFYYHGDDRLQREGPPGFWEAVDYWPETTSALLATGGKFSSTRALFRSHFVTYPLSPARHRSYYFWATVPFLPRQIERLYRLGEAGFFRDIETFNAAPAPLINRYTIPTNAAAAKGILKLGGRWIKEFAQRVLTFDQWFLLFSLEQDVADGAAGFVRLQPPKGVFWADPHIVQVDAKSYIFIEEFPEAKNKGHISVIEMDAHGDCKAPVKILEKDYHLSYPFVFGQDGTFYMIPESRANRTIDLYECVEFPYRWNFKQTLMENVSAVDTTLVRHAGKWWMFTAIAEVEAAAPNVELFLFYTDDIFRGKWTPHPHNPIISDVKRARPAGSFFLRDGKLFRPSQDCSHAYGYGFDLNEVEILSEMEYRERRVTSIRPDWDRKILATHTYARCGNLTVIDALRRISKLG